MHRALPTVVGPDLPGRFGGAVWAGNGGSGGTAGLGGDGDPAERCEWFDVMPPVHVVCSVVRAVNGSCTNGVRGGPPTPQAARRASSLPRGRRCLARSLKFYCRARAFAVATAMAVEPQPPKSNWRPVHGRRARP
eukprot:scaffold30088_cov101-Isochrysis_galbana.AAC.1